MGIVVGLDKNFKEENFQKPSVKKTMHIMFLAQYMHIVYDS